MNQELHQQFVREKLFKKGSHAPPYSTKDGHRHTEIAEINRSLTDRIALTPDPTPVKQTFSDWGEVDSVFILYLMAGRGLLH